MREPAPPGAVKRVYVSVCATGPDPGRCARSCDKRLEIEEFSFYVAGSRALHSFSLGCVELADRKVTT